MVIVEYTDEHELSIAVKNYYPIESAVNRLRLLTVNVQSVQSIRSLLHDCINVLFLCHFSVADAAPYVRTLQTRPQSLFLNY